MFRQGTVAGLAAAHAQLGRRDEALTLMRSVVKQAQTVTTSLSWIEAYFLVNNLEEAKQLALEALERAQNLKERGHEAWTLWFLGEIDIHLDPRELVRIETHYQQALVLANELGMRPLQAHCHRSLGTLYRQTGQSEQARAELATAIEMYRDMAMTFWLPETEAALAKVEGQ